MIAGCAGCGRQLFGCYPKGTRCSDCAEADLADLQARRAALAVAVNCPGCGESFLRRSPHHAACSDRCRQRLHRARVRAS